MSRVHDMGGRFGDGKIIPEPDGIPQLPGWQARALALTLASGTLGKWNIDVSRHARERLSPKDYARFSYFEKWVSGLADLLVETGVLNTKDFEQADRTRHPLADKVLKPEAVRTVLVNGGPANREGGPAPLFKAGDKVRIRAIAENMLVEGGHTRLPGYAAGRGGAIIRLHGTHVLPDSSAHRLGDAAEPLYAVAIKATDLWAYPENPDDEVVLDLWQSYLEAE